MRYFVPGCCLLVIASCITSCNVGWKHAAGVQILPEAIYQLPVSQSPVSRNPLNAEAGGFPAAKTIASCRVSFALPDGWHWVMRGDDFIATRDGVFLQNIHVERLHIDQVEQSDGMFPFAAFSSKQWPFRTVRYLQKRFELGMSPVDAADVVLRSRANTPGVSDFDIREVVKQEIAGEQGFKAVYDFRLKVQERRILYRTVYYGFIRDEWFYGISYTAAKRYYFEKDAQAFDSVLGSFRLVEK